MVSETPSSRLQLIVFALVSASFANVYITQPVLPVLQQEFGADMVTVSLTVSAVILGMALSNLPFGSLADRLSIKPIILTGGLMVALCSIAAALVHDLRMLIATRFVQGIFIPALTTCLAAYLARTLPVERLSIVMGSYVSATVLGGLGGRLLGGWVHPPLHWRYAFISAAAFILAATIAAIRGLPPDRQHGKTLSSTTGYLALLRRRELWGFFFCAAGSFSIFSSVFNYLPFRLTGSPFHFPTEVITLLYLSYIVGIFMGPTAGRFSNRHGSGKTLITGSLVLGLSLGIIMLPFIAAVVCGLLGVCAGFFAVHASAVGALNRRLSGGQGRANALYVLFYYLGGWGGITLSGFAYTHWGWNGVVLLCLLLVIVPLTAGIGEMNYRKRRMLQSSGK